MQRNTFTFSVGLFIAAIAIIVGINSCKKDTVTPLKNYLCNYGPWQLASLQRTTFVHNTSTANIISTDTLASSCSDTTQTFLFAQSGSCTNYDFQCNNKNYTGKWTLNVDSLVLHAYVQIPDTSHDASGALVKPYPFASCSLGNLGSSSLTFVSGDIAVYYPDTRVHTLYRYSFIHPTAAE